MPSMPAPWTIVREFRHVHSPWYFVNNLPSETLAHW